MATKNIKVDSGMRVCINCTHYQRYMVQRAVPGEAYRIAVPTDTGWCPRQSRQRGVLQKACRDYQTEDTGR